MLKTRRTILEAAINLIRSSDFLQYQQTHQPRHTLNYCPQTKINVKTKNVKLKT